MSTWPPKVDFDFTHKRPEAKVHYPARPAYDLTVPAFETSYSGAKYAFYDTEMYESETMGLQMVMFQRQLGQGMASYKHGPCKEEKQTNILQPSCLPHPHQFSLFGIAADYPISEYESMVDLGGSSGTLGFTALRDGYFQFAHATSRACFECRLRDLPTLAELQSHPIPDWFVNKSRELLENVVCGHIGVQGKKVFPTLAEKWTPEKDFRHIRPAESFQAVLSWEKKIPIVCPIKISMYGILWFPR